MAKVLRITDTDYRIIVGNGGTIYLDTTGAELDGSGKVVIRGDLEVKGNTTTVESTITTIADNILVLNNGNTSAGLPASLDRPYSSGIEIDRGLLAPARWIYDDNVSWAMGPATGKGAWLATQGDIGSETDIPIKITGIVSVGNLYVSVGSNVISVTGSNDYEQKIWRYESGLITPDPLTGSFVQDDDHIPNARAVKDLVDYSLQDIEIDKIVEDDTSIEIIDKNNVILSIVSVGSSTTVQTVGSHGYLIGDTITISGVTTSPTDAIIEAINGTWTVTDVPASNLIEFNRGTTGGDAGAYVTNSGSAVTSPSLDPTRISVTVEGNEIGNFYSNRIEFAGIQILGTEISTFESNQTLTLAAPGVGVVKVKDTLELTKTPGDDDGSLDPSAPVEGIRLYSKSPSTGKTGLYFVNEDTTRDEIISKNRALLYGMLF